MNKWKTKFKEIIIFVLGIIFATCVTVLAETCSTTLSSGNVTYDNTTVQAETTELITQAGNMDSRLSDIQNHFKYEPGSYFTGASGYEWLFISNTNSNSANKDRGIAITDSNSNRRSDLYFDPSSDKTILDARAAGSGIGSGTLDLMGNPVKINGTNITDLIRTKKSTNSTSTTVPAGGSVAISFNITLSGYSPIGIIQQGGSSNYGMAFLDAEIMDSNTAKLWITNPTSSAKTVPSTWIIVLYVKQGYVTITN